MTSVAISAVAPPLLRRISASSAVAAWNSAIKDAVNRKCFGEALHHFSHMQRSGHRPDWLTFPLILKSCANLYHELSTAMVVHATALKSPFFSDAFVQTSLLNVYLKYRCMHWASQLLEEMSQRDLPTWNTLLAGISQMGCSLSCTLEFFQKMRLEEVFPDIVTFLILAPACAAAENWPIVSACHSLAIVSGAFTDVAVKNSFVCCYSKCGDIGCAESVFYEISISDLTAVSWSSMIGGYVRHGDFSAAAGCFCEMRLQQGSNFPGNAMVSLLSLCTLFQGRVLHSLVIKGGMGANSIVGNALISLYCKCSDLVGARCYFDGMAERTSVSWSTMISGYASSGELSHAVKLFQSIEKPDEFAIAAIISESSDQLHLGCSLHVRSLTAGLDSRTVLCNSLMDMYMKNGCPKEAQAIFCGMESCRTVVSWTIVISGYALNGRVREALDLFQLMAGNIAGAPTPNAFTFLAVLQACSHGGLLEEGVECLSMMEELFKIVPSLEHYACMVDLLGRKRRLKEAMRFVQKMPVKPDGVIWNSLLGGCARVGEVALGEEVARRLVEMDPKVATAYVSLANANAAKQRWADAASLLVSMRRQGAKKVAGKSSIHAGGLLHSFSAQSCGHPETKCVEEVLLGLDALMRDEDIEF